MRAKKKLSNRENFNLERQKEIKVLFRHIKMFFNSFSFYNATILELLKKIKQKKYRMY